MRVKKVYQVYEELLVEIVRLSRNYKNFTWYGSEFGAAIEPPTIRPSASLWTPQRPQVQTPER